MRPDPEMIPILGDTARTLKGNQRRLFMAKAVKAMGRGGQRWAQEHLGWCRETIRKGMHELRTGMTCLDAFSCRRRKTIEEYLPRLLGDIRAIVDGQSQADPEFQTDRLFTRISAAEVRRQSIAVKEVQLAYYPPYHSKYNPIERRRGIPEMHWNGSLLDSIEAVLGYTSSMTWRGKHPEVGMVETIYSKGVRLKPKEMKALESRVVRLAGLGRWFVEIPAKVRDG